MTDVNPGAEPNEPEKWTTDQVGDWIVTQMNRLEELPSSATTTRQLLAVIASHMNEDRVSDVPDSVYEMEYLKAFLQLEIRIIRIEEALKKQGLKFPDMPSANF